MGEYLEADKLPGLEIIPNTEPDLAPDGKPRPRPGEINRRYGIDSSLNLSPAHIAAVDEMSEIPVG